MNSFLTSTNNTATPVSTDGMSSVYFSEPELDKHFTIKMPDDSMSGTIEAGEHLMVKHHSGNLWDAIYFYELDGHYYVKRLQTIRNKLLIISDNKFYQTWEANEETRSRMNILAMVTARCHIQILG